MKVLELFGGIGACSNALKRLNIDFEIVDYVEIDKYAVKSFNAIYNTNFAPQDIRNWDKELQLDLIMHGSPCQDFSIAGKQAGGNEKSGTRSSLMYETIRIIEKLKPKYVIWENVKNLLSKKHKPNFDNYISRLDELGYKSFYKVLNAKDYGIPQNRERVFTISILNNLNQTFEFPPKQELKLELKDLLESEVDEKYYLSQDTVNKLLIHNEKYKNTGNIFKPVNRGGSATDNFIKCNQVGQIYGTDKEPNPQAGRVYDYNGLSPTLDSCNGGNRMPKVLIGASRGRYFESPQILTKKRTEYGKEIRKEYEAGKIKAPRNLIQKLEPRTDGISNTITTVLKDNYCIIGSTQKHASIKNDGITPTLTSAMGLGGGHVPMHNYNYRIRKLTPKECWRLMGFSDKDFEKAEKVNSNTQLYKQAGNSIVVNVLEAIFRNLFKKRFK